MSKRLFLLRHAKAVRGDDPSGDFTRPLTDRGVIDARALGRHLAEAGHRPELVLCSPARRTRETWLSLAEWLKDSVVEFDPGLYGADAGAILTRLRQVAANVPSLMVIGHNPGIGDLALDLVAAADTQPGAGLAHMRAKFPTAALAVFTVPTATWSELRSGLCPLTAFRRPHPVG
ncbi:MAG: histidine phosphatase family protein [Alphaproteobacteria bacterium]